MKPSQCFAVTAVTTAIFSISPFTDYQRIFGLLASLMLMLMWASMRNERNDK